MVSDRELAELIASRLFVNGMGERGDRLQLCQSIPGEKDKERNLGGWCRGAVVDQIEDALNVYRTY